MIPLFRGAGCLFIAVALLLPHQSPAVELPPISPPPLTENQTTIKLPADASEVTVGGGGRFLCYFFEELKTVGIFDVSKAKLVKQIDVEDDDVRIAAGASKLFVMHRTTNTLSRWSLKTFEREASVQMPFQSKVGYLAMGSASEGPLLLAESGRAGRPRESGCLLFEIHTMKSIPIEFASADDANLWKQRSMPHESSADGRLFLGTVGPSARTLRLYGSRIELEAQPTGHIGRMHVGTFGRYLYDERGPFSTAMEPLGDADRTPIDRSLPSFVRANSGEAAPAVRLPYYALIKNKPGSKPGDILQFETAVYAAGDGTPLVTGLDIGLEGGSVEMYLDRRIHFIPSAKLFIVLNPTFRIGQARESGNDTLILTKFDVEAHVNSAKHDYLFVTSPSPPATMPKGGELNYQFSVRSKRGGVKYKLNSGPQGMQLAADGRLTWIVPSNHPSALVAIEVTISDASGRELQFPFKIAVTSKSATAVTAKPADPPKPATPTAQAKSIALPAAVEDLCIGGDGRFLIMHLKELEKFAVFDVKQSKIVKYIHAPNDEAFFAAGATKLVVIDTRKGSISRWSLDSFERELTQEFDMEGKLIRAIMGSASEGPMLVASESRTHGDQTFLIDLKSLRSQPFLGHKRTRVGFGVGNQARISANGKTIVAWKRDDDFETHVQSGGKWTSYHQDAGRFNDIAPSADGQHIYTKHGVYTRSAKRLRGISGYLIPAVHGNFFLRVQPKSRSEKELVTFHTVGNKSPLSIVGGLETVYLPKYYGKLKLDKRLLFLPDDNLIIHLNEPFNQLKLLPFNIEDALPGNIFNYLVVTSRPPQSARAGETLEYQIRAKSSFGTAQFKLESGPHGMQLSPQGVLTWQVPATQPGGETSVLISVTDSGGQQAFHTFVLEIERLAGAGNTNVVVGRPAPHVPKAGPNRPKTSGGLPTITPPQLEKSQTIVKLPSTVSGVAVGAGGRYLLYHLAELKKIAVFDVSQARVVKYLPAPGEDVLMAAGADKLIVLLRDQNIIARWSLTTFERELATQLQFRQPVGSIAMGSASQGPLLITGDDTSYCQFYDIEKLKPTDIKLPLNQGLRWSRQSRVMASPDGKLFVKGLTGSQALRIDGAKVQVFRGGSYGTLLPGPFGRFVYGSSTPLTAELKPIGTPVSSRFRQCIPAMRKHYYASVELDRKNSRPRQPAKYKIAVHVGGSTTALATVADIGLGDIYTDSVYDNDGQELHDRVHFVPSAKMFVAVAQPADHLVLTKFDVDSALADSDVDYLFVDSFPSSRVQPGDELKYQIPVRSKRGGVKYKLDSGPPGMTLSPTGLITWKVPAGHDSRGPSVVISISDKSGQEVFHRFEVAISRKTEPDAVAKREVPRPRPDPRVPWTPRPQPVAPAPAAPSGIGTFPPVTLPKIVPPALGAKMKSLKLPATASDVVVGGGGRFLIIHLNSLKQLAIFDTNRAELVKYIPATDEKTFFAAGASHLIVIGASQNVISRWNLSTLQREKTAPLPITGTVKAVAMGAASNGPLVVHSSDGTDALSQSGFTCIDPQTLSAMAMTWHRGGRGFRNRDYNHIRVSANGTLMTLWCSSHMPNGVNTFLFNNTQIIHHYANASEGFVLPSHDGRFVFTGLGVLPANRIRRTGDEPKHYNAIPATDGGFYISLGTEVGKVANGQVSTVTGARLYNLGDQRPLLTIRDIQFPYGLEVWAQHDFLWDKHIHLIPQAKLLVVIPWTNDRLELHHFDVERELEQSGIDYLVVMSSPPTAASLGKTYEYQLDVKSRKGGLKYKLETAPDGMTLSNAGKLQWDVPNDIKQERHDIAISVTDAAGQKTLHTFILFIPEIQRAAAQRARALAVEARRKREEAQAAARREAEDLVMRRTAWLALKDASIAADDRAKPARLELRPSYPLRKWTSIAGSTTEAHYVEVTGGVVVLRRPSGAELRVPGKKLSQADRDYVTEKYRAHYKNLQAAERRETERVQRQGDAETRAKLQQESTEKMRQIALALRVYAKYHGEYPMLGTADKETGEPLLSWRVALLPAFGHSELYNRFRHDEPWYSEHNRALVEEMPDIYQAPGSGAGAGRTNYVAVVGPDTVIRPYTARQGSKTVRFGSGVRPSSIRDNPSQTVLFIEASDVLASTWTRPDDVPFEDIGDARDLFGLRDEGVLAGFVDGSIKTILKTNAPATISAMFTYQGDEEFAPKVK